MGNITLATLDSQAMASAGRWLQDAERGVMRARDLTQQLLTFARGGEPVRSAVRLPEVLKEAAHFALHGSKVRCDFAIEDGLWTAEVDKGQIGQVVQNLVINAVQAMPDGGVMHISMRNQRLAASAVRQLDEGDYLCIVISDTGSGIRPEHLARIFDPYFTTKQSGSGLGLATVYSIIRKHQGHIEVESELGRGTRFRFWLPAVPDAAPAAAEVTHAPDNLTGRVLFMDDEEPIRDMANALLKRLGFDVLTVVDGHEVLRAYAEAMTAGQRFDLVIMDLTVPGGMGGKEAMTELHKLDPLVRGIVSSGYSSDPVMANYKAHGFNGMVAKPYRLTDLAKTIRSVLEDGHESV
jgi:CheY-like chemotaxis protein